MPIAWGIEVLEHLNTRTLIYNFPLDMAVSSVTVTRLAVIST
jgi:hypothetical protein